MVVNSELKRYIETSLFPEYEKNEAAHGIEHIKTVIDRSFELVEENNLDVNYDMVYVIAAYHDIGHHIDPKTHEIISADIMSKDKNLQKFFNIEELKIIKEAIEDHRSSADRNPRSIYGEIVSSADRNIDIYVSLKRSYIYGKKHFPNYTEDELFNRAYNVMKDKFGSDGYAKFYFKDTKYEKFLNDMRELLEDKNLFINTQREYIRKLKSNNEL
nr:HD domain-containing protein [Bacilli bacterium]